MKTSQHTWSDGAWSPPLDSVMNKHCQVVLLFGSGQALAQPKVLDPLGVAYPGAKLFGCSTAGEIRDTLVTDNALVATAIEFESSTVRFEQRQVEEASDSRHAGQELARSLIRDDLVHLFVLSDGLNVNGSELVRGASECLPQGVSVTGGLSADGDRFESTSVLCDGDASSGIVAAMGFYGEKLQVGYASLGGWDSFGPQRLITRSEGNILYELDGKPALDLYRRYLGEHADDLPSTGLLYPLSVTLDESSQEVVRTILAIDEDQNSLVFAGDVPVGARARLMKANFDRLVDGAAGAAQNSRVAGDPDLGILISCVGRKLVLGQRTEEEVEAVREALGDVTTLTGFYSYGEIAPFAYDAPCELHNQTMTITTFVEV